MDLEEVSEILGGATRSLRRRDENILSFGLARFDHWGDEPMLLGVSDRSFLFCDGDGGRPTKITFFGINSVELDYDDPATFELNLVTGHTMTIRLMTDPSVIPFMLKRKSEELLVYERQVTQADQGVAKVRLLMHRPSAHGKHEVSVGGIEDPAADLLATGLHQREREAWDELIGPTKLEPCKSD